jgi:hypothetical protein
VGRSLKQVSAKTCNVDDSGFTLYDLTVRRAQHQVLEGE